MINIKNVIIRHILYTCVFGACFINVMVYPVCWNAGVS